jgi:hypothetical protein
MGDLQVFKLVDVLAGSPTQDRLANSVRTVRLRIFGKASDVAEVTVNGTLCSSFSVQGENLLDVVIPTYLNSLPLDDLEFLILSSARVFYSRPAEILFDIGKVTTVIRGHDYLVQKWLRFLLMSPGSDKKDPTAGCGLLRLAGQTTEGASLDDLRVKVSRLHHECTQQIISRQVNSLSNLQKNELLKGAELLSIEFGTDGRLQVESLLTDGTSRSIVVGARL